MTLTWLQEASERFWSNAGSPRAFPYNVERAAVNALPLGILSLPRLWISDFACWMEQRGLRCPFEGNDRSLRGCLVAFGGRGFILVNGQDSDDERRFTVAHEVAHFILDYMNVRARAADSLGAGVLEVLDGKRSATYEERVHATISNASIGVHTHAMDRMVEGDIFRGSVLRIEEGADLLALELLAPAEEVYPRMSRKRKVGSFKDLMQSIGTILEQDFGLPKSVAGLYAYRLTDGFTHGPSIKEWLGLDE